MQRDTDRGTGRTTRQIREAPRDATYVWPAASSFWYARDIASKVGRTDLQFESFEALKDHRLVGSDRPVVIDHACHDLFCSPADREALSKASAGIL